MAEIDISHLRPMPSQLPRGREFLADAERFVQEFDELKMRLGMDDYR